jgi:hypothetical protein
MQVDRVTVAAAYREEAQSKRQMAERLTGETEKYRLLKEAEALDDLAQTLEEAAPT